MTYGLVMAYVLRGVIGSAEALQPSIVFRQAALVPLAQELFLLPMTEDFYDEVRRGTYIDRRFGACGHFPPGFERRLSEWSRVGPLAYVEANYAGGTGSQFGAVWRAGQLVLGPLVQAAAARPADPALNRSPVSLALCELGASATGFIDEFEAVGLGRHRELAGWLGEVP